MKANSSKRDRLRKSVMCQKSKPTNLLFEYSIFNSFIELFSNKPFNQKITKSTNKSIINKNIEEIEGKTKNNKLKKSSNFEIKKINQLPTNTNNTIENKDIDEKLDIKKPYNIKNQDIIHKYIENGFSLHTQRKNHKSEEIHLKTPNKKIYDKKLLKSDNDFFNKNTFQKSEKNNINNLNKSTNNNDNKTNFSSTAVSNSSLIKTFIDNINIGFESLFGNYENSIILQNNDNNKNKYNCKNRANSTANVNIKDSNYNKNKNLGNSNYMNEKFFQSYEINNNEKKFNEKNINNNVNFNKKMAESMKKLNLTKESKIINLFRVNKNNNNKDCNNNKDYNNHQNICIQNININNEIIIDGYNKTNKNINNCNFYGVDRLNKKNSCNDDSETLVMNENTNHFIYNQKKLLRNQNNLNKKKIKKYINIINISDIFFSNLNLNFKILLLKYLDNKSILNLSSVNKKFLIIKKKYYSYIYKKLTKQKEPVFIKKVLRSVFVYCSEKLKSKIKNKESLKLFYESINHPNILYDDLILKDLTRTLPNDPNFERNKKNSKKLYRLLTSFSNLNKEMGYVQGLNFICANAIFLFHDEEDVFLFINGFVNKLKLDYMGVDNEKKLVSKMGEISKILKKYVPEIYQFFAKRNLSHEFFTAGWILTLFSSYMDRSYLIICWCFFIIMGWKFIYSFIIQILEKYKETILNFSEMQLCSKMKNLLRQEQFKKDFQVIIEKTILFMENHIIL